MAKRAAFLPSLILTALICSLSFFLGCSETQPTFSEFTRTTLNLTPRSFPSPPDGMIYELWLLRNNETEHMSLGRFGWDQNIYIMRDENNVKRERVFNLDFNVLEWEYLAVSVENIGVPSPAPGPVFLWDRIQDPEVDAFMTLKFPKGYDTTVTGFMSIETPSDGNTSGDSSGVWFAVYSTAPFTIQDTTDIQVERTNPSPQQIPRDSLKDDSLGTIQDTIGIDSVFSASYIRFSAFNLDTFQVNTVRPYLHVVPINKDTVTWIDSSQIPPQTVVGRPDTITFGDATHGETVIYTANTDYVFRTTPTVLPATTTTVNNFSNGFVDLHSLRGTGWHYKGWIVGPHVGSAPSNFVRMNFGENKEFNWEKQGSLLYSTGIFLDTIVDSVVINTILNDFGPDGIDTQLIYSYSNEIGYNFPGDNGGYTDVSERPPFPGEDFLLNLPTPSIISGGLPFDFLGTAADTGIAFISIEPDNYMDSTRNFPLIVLAREIAPRPGIGTIDARLDNVPLFNQSGISEPFPNSRKSWPHIVVQHTLE